MRHTLIHHEMRNKSLDFRAAEWAELHNYPVKNSDSWDGRVARRWLVDFGRRVGGYGCPCKNNWTRYVYTTKPPFASANDFFEWGVVAHNYVSTHHVSPRKPEMTMADAYKMYDAPWPLQDIARQIL